MTWWAHEGISKKNSCGISTYDNWNFKPQISSIFHFDRASDCRMARVLGVKLRAVDATTGVKDWRHGGGGVRGRASR